MTRTTDALLLLVSEAQNECYFAKNRAYSALFDSVNLNIFNEVHARTLVASIIKMENRLCEMQKLLEHPDEG